MSRLLIEMFKMVTEKYDKDSSIKFKYVQFTGPQTCGNKLKLYQDHVHYSLQKYLLSNRVIHNWNGQPNSVIEANSVNSFKNKKYFRL